MFARHAWPKRITFAFLAVLLATWASFLVPGYALGAANPGAGGNNGTVKVCDGASCDDAGSANQPHLSCPISIHWTGFDVATAANPDTYKVTFTGINPSGGTVSVVGGANSGQNPDNGSFLGPDNTVDYQLQIANGAPNTKGEYHVSIDITTTTANGSDVKSKTVWLQSCAAVNPTQTATLSGGCDAGSHNYTWTIATAPPTQITGMYTPQGGTATSYTTSAPPAPGDGTTTFTTGHVNTVSFTVPAGWSASPVSGSVTLAADPNCAASTVDPSASVTATCTALGATLNAGTSATTFTVTESNSTTPHPVSVPANGTQTVSYTPGAGATISVSATGMTTVNGAAPATCPGGSNPTPPSASATSTCSAASVHLDAGSNPTDFTVTEPGGTHQVHVAANKTQDISYTPGAGVTISVSANGTVLSSATSPASCGPAGQAQPAATATDACITGITVVLDNMNGTAPGTFTVTAPDGTTETVTVNAGQLKKLDFAVAEDTTGVVTVNAPGLAKTFTYKKNCTKVLGEKHVVKPPKKPVVQVKGEKSQLPFTGFDALGAAFDALSIMALGAIVCALASPRRRRLLDHPEA